MSESTLDSSPGPWPDARPERRPYGSRAPLLPRHADDLWSAGERLACAAELVREGAPAGVWRALDDALVSWDQTLDRLLVEASQPRRANY